MLRTGADLLTDRQRQRIVAAYRNPDRRAGRAELTKIITAISRDAQIAAICQSRGATLATRNVDDFAGLGLDVVNPWTA